MHTPPLIRDLAVILATAGLVTLLFRKIRQPVVLGYIVAGIIVGPKTPPYAFVRDLPSIQTWSELGVIFLMFALGLEFSFHKLMRVGVSAAGTAIVEVVAMVSLGFLSGRILGWGYTDSLFLGGILAISSTTIIIKALEELNLKTRLFAQVVFGILIVEDLVAILLLVALSTVALSQTIFSMELVYATMKLAFIVGSWFIVGYFFIPSLLRYAGKSADDETLTVLSTGLCLGLVVLATSFHYSAALGAFIMGSILAETQQAHRIEALIQPVKNLFAAVFFVSVGMLVDPRTLIEHWPAVLLLTLVTIVGKLVSSAAGALISGQSPKHAIEIGFSLAQIGEFSFIIAALGATLQVTSDFLYPIAVAVSVITTFTTPYLIRYAEPVGDWVEKKIPPEMRQALAAYADRLTSPGAGDDSRRILMGQAVRFFISGIAASLIFLFIARLGAPYLEANYPDVPLVLISAWMVALALSAPFLWGMFYAFRTRVAPGQKLASLRGFRGLSPFFGGLGTVAWLGTLSTMFFQTTTTLVITFIGAGGLFLVFYRRLEVSYRWMETRFLGNLKGDEEGDANRKLDGLAPWDLHLVRLIVHANSDLVGRTLGEIDLRNHYGINVVVIQRGERIITPPAASDRLFPGDHLLVLGNDAQIDVFRAIATQAVSSHAGGIDLTSYTLRRFVVVDGSVFVGRTIRDSGIREKLKALVVGLERGSERMLNPHPTLQLHTGDVLWMVGGIP